MSQRAHHPILPKTGDRHVRNVLAHETNKLNKCYKHHLKNQIKIKGGGKAPTLWGTRGSTNSLCTQSPGIAKLKAASAHEHNISHETVQSATVLSGNEVRLTGPHRAYIKTQF